jgi:3-deoxy-D-manno-octulosonic-acid transferase
MILLFYNLALFFALVLSAPWWLWRMATTHKYREGLSERLGFVRLLIRQLNSVEVSRPCARKKAQGRGTGRQWLLAGSINGPEVRQRTQLAFGNHKRRSSRKCQNSLPERGTRLNLRT